MPGTWIGSSPEIIVERVTGFVVDSIDEAVGATERIGSISPEACRENAESRFSAIAMARAYERVYTAVAMK